MISKCTLSFKFGQNYQKETHTIIGDLKDSKAWKLFQYDFSWIIKNVHNIDINNYQWFFKRVNFPWKCGRYSRYFSVDCQIRNIFLTHHVWTVVKLQLKTLHFPWSFVVSQEWMIVTMKRFRRMASELCRLYYWWQNFASKLCLVKKVLNWLCEKISVSPDELLPHWSLIIPVNLK